MSDKGIPHRLTAEEILSIPLVRQSLLQDYAECVRTYACYFGHIKPCIELNKKVLFEAFGSAYCDIYRLTAFRGIVNADIHKRGAFLTKWIAKQRPIFIHRYDVSAVIPFINAVFAVTFAMTLLKIPPNSVNVKELRLGVYFNNLIYLLHYHACSPEQLASELFLLEQHIGEAGMVKTW